MSGWESEFIQERAEWTERPKEKSEVIQTSELGEKAIYSKELKSELVEEFFDKTLVRWGLLISGGYGLVSFFIDIFTISKTKSSNTPSLSFPEPIGIFPYCI